MEEIKPWYKSWFFWIALLVAFILATFVLPSVKCIVPTTGYPSIAEWISFFHYLSSGCPA